jgi:hypothetical protein
MKKAFNQLIALMMGLSVSLGVSAQSIPNSGSSIDGDGASLYKFDMNQELGIMSFVKFAVFLDQNKKPQKIVFQNTNKFAFHTDFLLIRPEFAGKTRSEIDALTLKDSPERRAILGTLFKHAVDTGDPGVGASSAKFQDSFEFVSNDLLPVSFYRDIQELLLKSSPETLIRSAIGMMASGSLKGEILKISSELSAVGVQAFDPFSSKDYLVFSKGWTVGQVKVVSSQQYEAVLKSGEINASTILVTDLAPKEIPPISGLILSEPTASSSHVALLSEMYGIPMVFDRKAIDQFKEFDNQWVYVRIEDFDIARIVKINVNDYTRLKKLKEPTPLKLTGDFAKSVIQPTSALRSQDLSAYGGKSVRLGLIKKTIPANAPIVSLAIPIYYFKQYFQTAVTPQGEVLQTLVNRQLDKLKNPALTYFEMTQELALIRQAIKETPIPEPILQTIREQLSKQIPESISRLKLRSSSNVEDGAEFNGAGLYDSEGVWFRNPPEGKENDFAKGLNKVWRSIYSDRGFFARKVFSVDESQVGMGVLVQETFKEELANGVSIWKPAADEWSGEQVRMIAFPGEELSVTNPATNDLPEISEYFENKSDNPGVASTWQGSIQQRTNRLPLGQSVLRDDQYQELAALMQKIAKAWQGPKVEVGLEFEWKTIVRNNKEIVLIKQVRPLVQQKAKNFSDGSKFMILGGFKELLRPTFPERTEAYAQHFCPEQMSVTLPSLTESELKKGTLEIPEIDFNHQGQNFKLQNIKARSRVFQEEGNAQPTYSIQFSVDANQFKGLQIELVSGYNGAQQIEDTYLMGVQGSAQDLNKVAKIYPEIQNYKCGFISPTAYYNGVSGSDKYSELKAKVKLKDGIINLYGRYRLVGGYDKTFFFEMQDTQITGFGLPGTQMIKKPRAVVYAPAHHNFEWGVSVDLFAIEGVTEQQKKTLDEKFGRYLMMTFDNQGSQKPNAYWLKSIGVLSKPVKATWSN